MKDHEKTGESAEEDQACLYAYERRIRQAAQQLRETGCEIDGVGARLLDFVAEALVSGDAGTRWLEAGIRAFDESRRRFYREQRLMGVRHKGGRRDD